MRWPYGRVAVSGPSMAPTLAAGDFCVVRYGARPRLGDVVVARRPGQGELLVVKRVLRRTDTGWWLRGDNTLVAPAVADDSRVFGSVPEADVLGRVVCRYWPWRTAGLLRRQARERSSSA